MRLKRPYLWALVAVIVLVVAFLLSRTENATAIRFSTTPVTSKAGPEWLYPDPNRTPGFANLEITQANIEETICNPEWHTKSIRPPSSYTSKLKKQQMLSWGLSGTTTDYEEDHFISLELGGNPTDPRNLWPEPYYPSPGARQKDVVENYLHKQVCSGTITLKAAQDAITTDWYEVYLKIHKKSESDFGAPPSERN